MSVAEAIPPHLPYLRRYARMLSGSQKAGDAYVIAALESIIADAGLVTSADLKDGTTLRIALYRILARVGNVFATNEFASGGVADDPPMRNIEAITPLPRQAFLLTTVEGFTPEQAAEILEVSSQRLSALLDQAGREIAEQVATDVLIIEDEPLISMDLANIVEGLGHRVVGRARTHAEAIKIAQLKVPGLVLADIKLADDSSGLDAVNELLGEMDVAVIFVTAYPERLLTGDRPEPTFLIAKPFTPDTVKAIVSQALFFGVIAKPGARSNPILAQTGNSARDTT
jgi:DNA-directed RNA polymerase specialized sigma24 family protein/CheY-like chemotaxis protein